MGIIRSCLILILIACLAGPVRAAEGGGEGKGAGPVYARLKPISFSVIGNTNKIEREVSILLSLELHEGKLEAEIEPNRRRLMDALFLTLSDVYDSAPPGNGPVPLPLIKERLLETAREVLGKDFVDTVLVISIGERPHKH